MKNSQKRLVVPLMLTVFLVGGGMYIYSYPSVINRLYGTPPAEPNSAANESNTEVQSLTKSTADNIPTWKTYRSDFYGIEIRYPSDWIVEAYTTHDVIFSPPGAKAKSAKPEEFRGFISLSGQRGWGRPSDLVESYGTMFDVDPATIKHITVAGRDALVFPWGSVPTVRQVLFEGEPGLDGSHRSYALTKEDIGPVLETQYHVEDVFSKMTASIKVFPPPVQNLTGITLPAHCKVVAGPGDENSTTRDVDGDRLQEGQWKLDCGNDRNNDARGTMSPILKGQGWIFCDGGMARAYWWKDGISIGVYEGEGEEFPFSVGQTKSLDGCSVNH